MYRNNYTQWPFHTESGTVEARKRNFTNMDRRPQESESVRAVKQALREMLFYKREIMAETTRAERQRARDLERARTADPVEDPRTEPVAEPVAEVEAGET